MCSSDLSTPTSSWWTIATGSDVCSFSSDGACVESREHGANEVCTFTAMQNMYVSSTYFATEVDYDHITIGGVEYSGSAGPFNLMMASGSNMIWSSDGSVNVGGFTICASVEQVVTTTTAAPSSAFWTITAGSDDCSLSGVNGECVESREHGVNEACTDDHYPGAVVGVLGNHLGKRVVLSHSRRCWQHWRVC